MAFPRDPHPPRDTDDLTINHLTVGSMCTGYGGLDLGVLAALGGGRLAWVADPDRHIKQILDARMPGTPNLGDLRAVDWTRVEPVDVLVAGFPCQDISAAGKRAGIEKGSRSGLWTDIVASLRVLRPALVVVENVAALRWKGGGLHRVLGDLAEAGYDALWRSVRAADIGAPHRRERVFLLGWLRAPRTGRRRGGGAADTDCARRLVQWHQRHHPTGRPLTAGSTSALSDTNRDQSQRRRGHDSLARPPGSTSGTTGQRKRHGDTAVDRGALASDADRGGLSLLSDPDRAELGPPDPGGLDDTDGLGPDAAHSDRFGREDLHPPHPARWPVAVRHDPSAAVATGHGRHEGQPGTTRIQGRPDAALGDHSAPHHAGGQPDRRHGDRRHLVAVPDPSADTAPSPNDSCETEPAPGSRSVSWGVYEAAIRHWETLLGRSAPHPTQPGKQGRPVLAPTFVEHLMGLPSGWVTDLHLPRTAQLRALGNGVVPQQAAHAVSLLLADLADLLGTDIPGTEFPIADHRSPAGQAVDENVDEDGDPDGCSPWSCRSGEPVTAAVDTERAA